MTCTLMGERPTSLQKNSGKNLTVMPLPSMDTTSETQTVAAILNSCCLLSFASPSSARSGRLNSPKVCFSDSARACVDATSFP